MSYPASPLVDPVATSTTPRPRSPELSPGPDTAAGAEAREAGTGYGLLPLITSGLILGVFWQLLEGRR